MNNEDPSAFDFFEADNEVYSYESAINWWEAKRLWFNVIVGFAGLLCLLFFSEGIDLFILFGATMWGIAANVLYSAGMLVEIMDIYYLKRYFGFYRFRLLFFVLGVLAYCFASLIVAASFFSIYAEF